MYYYKTPGGVVAVAYPIDGEEITEEEFAALKAGLKRPEWTAAMQEYHERHRPLTDGEVLALLIPGIINTAQVDDNTALRMRSYYPQWQPDADYAVGHKVQSGDRLWRCRQAHRAITGWEPENVASLWEEVCESHTGAEDDPIPYNGNMALVNGLHYVQDGEWYRCIRDTVNPVYHALADLVGLYVERV